MEDPLLPSSSSSRTRRRRCRSHGSDDGLSSQDSGAVNVLVGRRVGAITSGNKYEKAAAMVDQVFISSLCLLPLFSPPTPTGNPAPTGSSRAEFLSCPNLLLSARISRPIIHSSLTSCDELEKSLSVDIR